MLYLLSSGGRALTSATKPVPETVYQCQEEEPAAVKRLQVKQVIWQRGSLINTKIL